jgi:hypothetical protein
MSDSDLASCILSDPDFLAHYRRHEFWHGKIPPAKLTDFFSWRHLNDLFSTHRLTNDRLRLSLEDDHVTPNKVAFHAVRDRFGRMTDFLSVNEFHRLMRSGVTGVLEAVNELNPAVEAFTKAISLRHDGRSTANAYISFGSTSGFGAHNDDHDVIVVQLEGRKTWNFFAKAGSPGKATVDDLDMPIQADVGETITLTQGSVLFVPKGTWHDVIAINEPSLHLTISIVYPTIADYVKWLLQRYRYDVPYCDIRMNNEELGLMTANCITFFEKVIDDESLTTFLNAHYARQAAHRIQPSFPSLNRVDLGDAFIRVPFSFIDLGRSTGCHTEFSVYALGKQFTLNEAEHYVLTQLSHKHARSAAELVANDKLIGLHKGVLCKAIEGLLDKGLASKVYESAVTDANRCHASA